MKGKISLYCYINLTDKPNTARNTAQKNANAEACQQKEGGLQFVSSICPAWKDFLLYESKGGWHTKQSVNRHLELRNRNSYQVGSVQGKEIEKSENICSSDKSGIEIPNGKNNIFFKLPVFYLDT